MWIDRPRSLIGGQVVHWIKGRNLWASSLIPLPKYEIDSVVAHRRWNASRMKAIAEQAVHEDWKWPRQRN